MAVTNIKSVYAMFNEQKITATYSEATGLWTVEAIAPSTSSWFEPDHVYTFTLYAEDYAGNVAQVGPTDPDFGNQLKIRVMEKSKPTAVIIYPGEGSVIGKSAITVQFRVTDAGGSGIHRAACELYLNGQKVAPTETYPSVETEDHESYDFEFAIYGLSDGANTIKVIGADNDDNHSDEVLCNFIVSTSAPILDVTQPIDKLITNAGPVTVKGISTPGSEYVTISEVTVNGEPVDLDGAGNFSTDVSLIEGENVIEVVATDTAGNTTTVRRTITLDTLAPLISDVTAEATVVESNQRIRITFKVTEV